MGKTVLIHHAIQKLMASGVDPRSICYISVDHPIYNGCTLDDLLDHFAAASGGAGEGQRYVFFEVE